MNILVTGGTGYIGSHISYELLKENHRVMILDNLSNSQESVLNKINKISAKEAIFFKGNIQDKFFLNDKYVNGNISFIEFLLSKINFKIRIIQISSLSVYISNEKENFYNENSMLNPVSNYGKIK